MKKSPKEENSKTEICANHDGATGDEAIGMTVQKPDADGTLEIVSAVKSGDTVAFIRLLGIFSHTISALARSFSLPDSEYEDLCQEGRMALYRASMSYDEKHGAKFSTFAVSCMTNAMITLCNKYNATNKAIAFELSAEDEGIAVCDGRAQRISFGEVGELLSDGADGIFSKYERRVMSLKISGYKVSEIAKIVGKSPKSVENTLFRARKKLKNQIG